MRFTGVFGIAALVVLGVMAANLEMHPAGATAAANGIVNIEKPGLNALLGKTS
jgi:hypothetical protein